MTGGGPDAGGAAGADSTQVPAAPTAPEGSARALVAAIGVLWGLNWPAVRIILEDLPPWTTRAVGLGCGALALFALAHLAEVARARGWSVVRWITADDNYRARTLYDRVARKTSWNLYELTP